MGELRGVWRWQHTGKKRQDKTRAGKKKKMLLMKKDRVAVDVVVVVVSILCRNFQ